MSRVAYAALGKRGSFSRDTRYTAPPADAVPAAPTEDAAEQAYRAGYEDGQISTRAECEAQLQAERAARSAIETAFARFDAESGRHLRERLLETVHALCEEAVLPLALDDLGQLLRDIRNAVHMHLSATHAGDGVARIALIGGLDDGDAKSLGDEMKMFHQSSSSLLTLRS
jgi:flagellar assembly protein FliH